PPRTRNARGGVLRRRPVGTKWYPKLRSDATDVRGLQTLRSAGHVELEGLALGQRLEALTLDRGEVHEHVLTAVLGDETETLRLVNPLQGAASHFEPPCIRT